MRYIVYFLFFIFGMCVGITSAKAHSWYPMECCSDADCWPMGEDADAKEPDPKIVPGGYLTHDGIFVAEKDVRYSPDGRYHICRYGGRKDADIITAWKKPLCMWVPSNGS